MSVTGISKIDVLTRDNYDTWRIRMEALLIKGELWGYVSGEIAKPEGKAAAAAWIKNDLKAKAEILLAIGASEVKQIKGCGTSREVWLKLESIHQSKRPARKTALLTKLALTKMNEGNDVREHLNCFFDTVDKLAEMDIEINKDLLSILLLHSLPDSFENFRCAIKSWDDLPDPEILKIKILEESDGRSKAEGDCAMVVSNKASRKAVNNTGLKSKNASGSSKIKCFRCARFGHKVAQCSVNRHKRKHDDTMAACYGFDSASLVPNAWCLDSGATPHVGKDPRYFTRLYKREHGTLNLATHDSCSVDSGGSVRFTTLVNSNVRHINLENALHVPELRTNLLSVSQITDKGFLVVFDKNGAKVIAKSGRVSLVAKRENDLYLVKTLKPVNNSF